MAAFRRYQWVLWILTAVLMPSSVMAQPQSVRGAAERLLGPTFTGAQIDAVASVLGQQIATFPIGSSSGGFTLRLDPNTGTLNLKSPSFGPLFAERASTLGEQGLWAVAVNSQATKFESFEGRQLRNGELASRAIVNGQLVTVNAFTFDVRTHTTAISMYYAVDNNIDLGVILPVVTTSLSGTSTTLVPQTLRYEQRIVDASATGIGDVVVRGKWNFLERPNAGLSAAMDVFVPTGSEQRLAGTGQWRVRPQLVASAVSGTFSPHVNIGFTAGGDGVRVADDGVFLPTIQSAEPGDEFNYVIGADVAPHKSLTAFADLIGRSYRSIVRFDSGVRLFDYPGVGPVPLETFVAREGTLHARLGVVGMKTIVLTNGLLTAALLFPLNDGGVKSGVTPVIGFEYTFGR